MTTIKTFNSRTCIYGNRRNLVVNEETKEFYYSGCNAYNLGEAENDLGIREVNWMYKDLKANEEYTEVSHAHVRDSWMK